MAIITFLIAIVEFSLLFGHFMLFVELPNKFVFIGEFVGFSGIISFSIAMGRRLREILVGLPALLAWYLIFRNKIKAFN